MILRKFLSTWSNHERSGMMKYESLIDTFKQMHSKRDSLKKTTSSVQEIQKDVLSMETEKENIAAKLSNVKRKVWKEWAKIWTLINLNVIRLMCPMGRVFLKLLPLIVMSRTKWTKWTLKWFNRKKRFVRLSYFGNSGSLNVFWEQNWKQLECNECNPFYRSLTSYSSILFY